jgi:hypothetical protein
VASRGAWTPRDAGSTSGTPFADVAPRCWLLSAPEGANTPDSVPRGPEKAGPRYPR